MTNKLTTLGYKLFLDRYAKKSLSKFKLSKGNVVVYKDETGAKQIGEVAWHANGTVEVNSEQTTEKVPRDWVDVPLETKPEQLWARVAAAMASVEDTKEKQAHWESEFEFMLKDWKFVPGGRILAGAGIEGLTYYNCFVIPSPKDSKTSIFASANILSQLMSRGGGVGVNISTLRPKYSRTYATNGRSSGAVSWGELYSFVTGLIEQGGSRRGALMIILDDWHPDIEEFIAVKRDMSRIINANISIGISDDFMEAVEADSMWNLEFPDTSHKDYDEHWDGNLQRWKETKGEDAVIVHKTLKAKELWDDIIQSAWACAEPGLWFKERSNKESNSWYYADLVSTNPCGEIPLAPWGVCNLGAINLSQYVRFDNDQRRSVMDWHSLKLAVKTAVRFLDNAIDATPYHFAANEQQQKGERKIGLGTMGLAEVLLELGITYGSERSLIFMDKLYSTIAITAYEASIRLAEEKGTFPFYVKDKYAQGSFIQRLPAEVQARLADSGIRNVTLLTQAPTGTTGTMVNTSTGIEPYYAWEWERVGRFGKAKELARPYENYLNSDSANGKLPKHFVTAQDLTPEDHIKVQATVQQWVDNSISKTCNVPAHYTKEQVGELYMLMYDLGCKGGTVYRDKSRNEQVLHLPDDESAGAIAEWRLRPPSLQGETYRQTTPAGTLYVTINHTEDGPFEVFLNIGKAGSELMAQAEAMGRLISYILRMPSSQTAWQKIGTVVGQLKNIGSGRSYGFGPNRISSMADAIARTLEKSMGTHTDDIAEGLPEDSPISGDLCPECGQATLVRMEGCRTCMNCGHGEC